MAAAAQDVGAGGGTPQLRLAPHFPFVPKPCAAVAEPFFQCFSDKSVQPEGGDPHSGRRALAACAELMKPYDECTRKHLASRKQKIYRAPEAYTKPESQ